MWTRKELKDKAKVSFKANYWKTVFVALVLMMVVGGMSFASSAQSVPAGSTTSAVTATSQAPVDVTVQQAPVISDAGAILIGISVFIVVLIATAIVVAMYVFVFSPLEVGAQRFFVRNLNQRAEVKEVAFGYDNNYMEIVKTLFLRDLFILLWTLLLIIPGIYKSYEYRMIPYLLAEDPTMTKDRAFAESKRMMYGHKWNTFVLDLSFLGWNILSALTLGIVGVFYVTPYQSQTNAALYEKLRYGLPAPDPVAQPAPVAPVPPASYMNAQGQAMPVIVPASQPPVPPFAQVNVPVDGGIDTTAPLPESGIDTTEVLPVSDADTTEVPPAADADTTEALPTADTTPTEVLPASDADTTEVLPETGIDPTIPMPGSGENDAEADSPKA